MHLTTAERRGALLMLALFALGAAHDLWRAHRPPAAGPAVTPPASAMSGGAPPALPGVPPMPATPGPPAPLDLNRAGVADLDALPGIGPVLAGRIVAYRRRHGPFRAPEDLLAVRGIGPAVFERLRGRVRAGPAAPAGGTPPAGEESSPGAPRAPVQSAPARRESRADRPSVAAGRSR